MNRKEKLAKRLHRVGLMVIVMFVAAGLQVSAQSRAEVSNRMPPIEVVGVGDVHRISNTKNTSGQFLPPWTTVEVTNVFGFNIQPKAVSRATFVPVNTDVQPFDLNLTGSTIQDGCEKSSPKWWSAEFQAITDKHIFDVKALAGRSEEYPFDVIVIYPAVSSAWQIPKRDLKPEMLPAGVKIGIVKAAIEVTGDGFPDIVVTEYCCADAGKTTDCDLTCGATYKRSGKKWNKIDRSEPC